MATISQLIELLRRNLDHLKNYERIVTDGNFTTATMTELKINAKAEVTNCEQHLQDIEDAIDNWS